jgi:hypothetical protein
MGREAFITSADDCDIDQAILEFDMVSALLQDELLKRRPGKQAVATDDYHNSLLKKAKLSR